MDSSVKIDEKQSPFPSEAIQKIEEEKKSSLISNIDKSSLKETENSCLKLKKGYEKKLKVT